MYGGPAEIRTQDLSLVKAGTSDVCTVNDEPTSISLPFLLNEQLNQQNTDEQKSQDLNNSS